MSYSTFNFSKYAFLVVVLLTTWNSTKLCAQSFVEDSVKYGSGKVYTSPDIDASFPGGRERMYQYIDLRFDEGQTTMTGDVKQGTIEAKFIVEPNGKITYVEYMQSLSPTLDDDMTRALISMPKWKPAMAGGIAVRSFQVMRYTVKF